MLVDKPGASQVKGSNAASCIFKLCLVREDLLAAATTCSFYTWLTSNYNASQTTSRCVLADPIAFRPQCFPCAFTTDINVRLCHPDRMSSYR